MQLCIAVIGEGKQNWAADFWGFENCVWDQKVAGLNQQAMTEVSLSKAPINLVDRGDGDLLSWVSWSEWNIINSPINILFIEHGVI